MKAMFCDMYNFQITGDVSCNLNASSCNSPTHSGPSILILNDQGGDIMNFADDVTSTLRAQDHGHPPVVCFEPGIMSRDCSAGNRAYINICSTLRAQMGDNQPAVCFQQNQREEVRNMGEQSGALTADSGMHNTNYVCYAIDSHPMDSRFQVSGDVSGTVTSKLAKGAADGPLVMIRNEQNELFESMGSAEQTAVRD